MAAKASSESDSLKIAEGMDPHHVQQTTDFLRAVGFNGHVPQYCNTHAFHAKFIGSYINVDEIYRGRIVCTFIVKPPILNALHSLHGGAVGSIAELVATACARTVVTEDENLFLGEMSLSYLSGAPKDAEVQADASVVKRGRNLTVVVIQFTLKETGKFLYTSRATFYKMPAAKL